MDNSLTHIRTLQPFLQPYVIFMVNEVRAQGFPLLVISGRRQPNVNHAAGGAEKSLHLDGLAWDFQYEGVQRAQVDPRFWQILGTWWESVGGRWGGRFTPADVNHFDTGLVSLIPQ